MITFFQPSTILSSLRHSSSHHQISSNTLSLNTSTNHSSHHSSLSQLPLSLRESTPKHLLATLANAYLQAKRRKPQGFIQSTESSV